MYKASFTAIYRILRIMSWIVIAIIVTAEVGLLVLRWRGYEVLSVQSNSMQPVLSRGDAVTINRSGLKPAVGTIVAFSSPEAPGVTISHRVISVDSARGTVLTKGDSADGLDPAVPLTAIRGTVIAATPFVGTLIDLFRRPLGLVVAVYLPVIAIVVYEIRRYAWSLSAARMHYKLHSYRP